MSKKKKHAEEVEWLDERAIGHSSVKYEGKQIVAEVRISGSVMVDGVEYVIDEVVSVRGDKCSIGPNGELLT